MTFGKELILFSNPHNCRAQHTITNQVALLQYINDLTTFVVFTGLFRDRFMLIRVKLLTFNLHFTHPVSLQRHHQLTVDQFDPIGPGSAITFRRAVRQRTLQISPDRQLTLRHATDRILIRQGLISFNPAFVV